MDHNKLWKILQELGIPNSFTCLLRNTYAGQEETVTTEQGTMGWCNFGKGVRQSVYLTYIKGTSQEIPDWMKHKLESRLLGELSIISDMQMTPPLWQKVKKN